MIFDVGGTRLDRIECLLRYRLSVDRVEIALKGSLQCFLVLYVHVSEIGEIERYVLSSDWE